jgi:hypothetical protein
VAGISAIGASVAGVAHAVMIIEAMTKKETTYKILFMVSFSPQLGFEIADRNSDIYYDTIADIDDFHLLYKYKCLYV